MSLGRRRLGGALGAAALATSVIVPYASLSHGHAGRQTVVLAGGPATDPPPGVWFASQAGLTSETLPAVQSGGAPGASHAPSGDAADPVAINSTDTRLIAGLTTSNGNPDGMVVFNPQTGSSVGSIPQGRSAFEPIAFAMDPTNPTFAWAVESNICGDCGSESAGQVVRINLNTLAQTFWVTLPTDISASGGPADIAPSSAAIAPSGSTLYVGWGSASGTNHYGIDSVPLNLGPKPSVFDYVQSGTGQQNGPPTSNNSSNGSALPDVTDVALTPDGSKLFAAITSTGGDAGAVFEFTTPLGANSTPVHRQQFRPTTRSLSEPFALSVSPDGQTVYAGGVAAEPQASSGVSYVSAYTTAALTFERTVQVPGLGTGLDPSGINAMAISPDGSSLLVFGFDENDTGANATVAYSIPLPGLGSVGARVVITDNIPAEDFAPPYGPQDVVVTPDQAPVARLAPTSGSVGSPVTLDASSSTVAYGNIVRYAWNFGDGQTTVTSTPSVTHTYAAPSSGYAVTVTEADSDGTSLPPAPGSPFAVNTTGKTAYLDASSSAEASEFVAVSPRGVPPPHTTTTKPGVKKYHPALTCSPTVGPPGTIVTITGKGFPPNAHITVSWSLSSGSIMVTTDPHGNLGPTQLPILIPDVLGQRFAVASGTPAAKAAFLVVPGTAEPGGSQGIYLFRSDGP